MERARWTDERLDDRMSGMDTTFDRVFEEMRTERADMRSEMRALREELGAEMRALRTDFTAETCAIRGDISALQRQVTRIMFGFAVGLLGVVTAGIGAAVAGL